MLSSDTQNLLARILLSLAEGERKIEEARKEISNEDSYDIQAIFRTLDNNGDNFITPKDIQKYLNSHGLEVNLIEIKLIILFYDQDHDFSLTYGEIFKIVHPGREFPKIPQYKRDEELNIKVDEKLYNLLEKEILMARTILALLDEIKRKRDFNIHSCFHALKYYACITGDSINLYLKNCGMRPTAGDIRAIVKRLDINKDEIIDFCEFHAFLGFPDCTFCCPCFPCGSCGIKYCENCLQDIPCYLLGCDHKGMDSKMRCTSFEHNPRLGVMSSLYDSFNKNKSPNSMHSNKYNSRRGEDEEEKNDSFSRGNKFGNNPSGYNTQNGQFYPHGRNGFSAGNLSPEQFKLLQGLTNPEQLHKFMTISGILDRQNAEEINLTDNLSLRLSPIRDFSPKEWGCRNCPCNIHANPNVACDCCTCDICPFKSNRNINPEKQKQIKFPRYSKYSYSYSYEPKNTGPDQSFLSTIYGPNNSIYINSPKRRNIIYDKETNRYKTTNPNSSDDEEEYNDYMRKVNTIRNNYDSKNNRNSQNNMIYNDEMSNNNAPYNNYKRNNKNNNINRENNDEEEELYNNRNRSDENENEGEMRHNKILLNQIYKNEKNQQGGINRQNKNINKKMRNNDEEGEIDEDNQIQDNNNPKRNNNGINSNDNYSPDRRIPNQNINSSFPNINGNNENIANTLPNKVANNGINNNDNFDFSKDYNNIPLSKTVVYQNNFNPTQSTNNKKIVSGAQEEESEEDLSNAYKSIEEIIDEDEKIFIKYLKLLIKSEKEIEFAKRDLMRQEDFNAEDAFRLFEVEKTGVVTKKDMKFGLKLLGIKPTNIQIDIIFNKYDLDGNGFLDYDNFFDMVISFKDDDRKKEEKRKANKRVANRRIEIFSQKTRELYKKLFLVIIEEEERLENFKQKYNFSEDIMNEIFNKININRDGICDKREFAKYCIDRKICLEKKDAYLAFIRLNKDRDGGLQSKEFSNEMKSSVLGNNFY